MKPTPPPGLAVALALGAAFASFVLALSPALAWADDGLAGRGEPPPHEFGCAPGARPSAEGR